MLVERGALRQAGHGWSLEPQRRPADAGERARGHRQPDRPARRRRTGRCCRPPRWWACSSGRARSPRPWARPVESVERALRRLEQRDLVHEQPDSTMAGAAGVPVPARPGPRRLLRAAAAGRAGRPARADRRLARRARRRAGDTDLAEVVAHHRWAAYEIARTLGLDTARTPRAGPGRRCTGRPAGRTRCTRSTRPPPTPAGALAPGRRRRSGDRLQLELLGTELAFYRDGDSVPRRRRRRSGCTELADRLLAARRPRRRRPGLDAARPGRLAAGRPGRRRCACLDRAVELFDDAAGHRRRRRTRYAELGRLHMLNYERDPAVAAAETAAEIAERLGLVETARQRPDHHRHGPLPGRRPGGLDELQAIVEFCRAQQLLALPPGGAEPRLRAARGGRLAALRRACSSSSAARTASGHTPDHQLLRRGDARVLRRRLRPAARRRGRVRGHPDRRAGTCRSAGCAAACWCCAASRSARRPRASDAGRRRRRR